MGTPVITTLLSIPGIDNIVAPYGADINPNSAGTVRYTTFITDYSQINTVSSFIRSQITHYFHGTRMMIAEWNGVPRFGRITVSLYL